MLLIPETLEELRTQLRDALESGEIDQAVSLAARLSSARVASVLMEAPEEHVGPFLMAMDARRSGDVMSELAPEFAAELLSAIPIDDASRLFAQLPEDHAADVLDEMGEEDCERLLSVVGGDLRRQIETLRRHPDHSVGSVMTPQYLAIAPEKTVKQTLDALLSAPPDVERTHYVYVVNDARKPIGVLSLRDLIRLDPGKRIREVMNPHVIAFHTSDSAAEAATVLRNRRFVMAPVVDDSDALVGVLTVEDAMRILAENVADQFAALGGGTREESFFTPPMAAVKGRLPWMAVNVFLNLGAVAVISGFEDTIAQVAILAAFLPMITDMGGNVGIQALSVSIRSMALNEVRLRDYWKALRKEVAIGVVNGLALGALFALVAWIMRGDGTLGALAGVALGCNVLVAGVAGGCLPFLIKRMGKDPAMMTGPVLTTITDITGVTIYLSLSTIFLSQLTGGAG